MNQSLTELYGGYSPSNDKANMGRVMGWLVERANEYDDEVVAGIFANVKPSSDGARNVQVWLNSLRDIGYRIGVIDKDKWGDLADVDEMMVGFIEEVLRDGEVREVIIGSHDAKRFSPLISELQAANIKVSVLGYYEKANGYKREVDLIDIESIEGAFREPLPRGVNIFGSDIPAEGKIFMPARAPRIVGLLKSETV
jgi:uncharacterized protein